MQNSDTLALTIDLISRQSVTPDDGGCQQLMMERLAGAGFQTERMDFGSVQNFWATNGTGSPVLCFAGHTDVVPTGPLEEWRTEPFKPTVIDGLPPDCETNQEEIFGPVVTLLPFGDEREALAIANGTPYGLASSIWSRDIQRCHRVAARLESGLVWVNTWMLRDLRTPMGGVKQSGLGREGGLEAMRFFTEPRNVCVKY